MSALGLGVGLRRRRSFKWRLRWKLSLRMRRRRRSLNMLRRHKLPAPHLALWPTEVHVVARRKVCEKGCYFGGIYPPPVAIGKMKVCM